ncbi:hypothetical protein Ferp_0512 [Ferroglobus placidus DSM 10642]|uniref:Uncharacterized protein n=1 Tax=Ferroglobus placidus (strain DSM 10642 / AEDII12DO) TaxID=589924 RepID=D3S353_FERPA|nr:hypothetical protein [Ferroglobus placidus]ADC64686.1 hypothetical protein Ferp_0512 [Ferroglobus placidus DSM 10642]
MRFNKLLEKAVYGTFILLWGYYWHHYYSLLSWFYDHNPEWWEPPVYFHVVAIESWLLISLIMLTLCAFMLVRR